MTDTMKIKALAPWFGGNRMNAEAVGQQLAGCSHITIPFAGSMSEVPSMPPKAQVYVCDLHSEIIRLARIVADDEKRAQLAGRLESRLFHPTELSDAQERMRSYNVKGGLFGMKPASLYEVERAADWFTCVWMGRNGTAGSDAELNSGLALRSCGHGGDPSTRFRNAVSSLEAWAAVLRRCQFACESCWETLPRVAARARALSKQGKEPKLGIYCDAPWPDDGGRYLHPFTEDDQRRLAWMLRDMPRGVRIVVRYGDHPLIRELYADDQWTWIKVHGRTQTNAAKNEVLIINGPEYVT